MKLWVEVLTWSNHAESQAIYVAITTSYCYYYCVLGITVTVIYYYLVIPLHLASHFYYQVLCNQ